MTSESTTTSSASHNTHKFSKSKRSKNKFKCSLKFEIPNLNYKDKLKQFPDVIEYIETLHEIIKKQRKKIKKIKLIVDSDEYQSDLDGLENKTKTEISSPSVWSIETKNNSTSLAEQVKQVAENALQNTGLVYEPTSGMYYDYNTGYYYNAENGLYYDGNSGCYYYFDEKEKKYVFHSQTELPKPKANPTKRKSSKKEDGCRHNIKKSKTRKSDEKIPPKHSDEKNEISAENGDLDEDKLAILDLEDGECSEHESEAVTSEEDLLPDAIATAYPPCMRIIVQDSSLECLKIGTLFLVTYKGGTLGREGDHEVLIPDLNISKHHIKISFNEEENKYFAVDLGSRNGSILNGQRMSSAKQESDPIEMPHSSVLQVGGVKLLCHTHQGNSTCEQCEPGLVQLQQEVSDEIKPKVLSKSAKQLHRQELKRLKKKFGVKIIDGDAELTIAPGYQDRAQCRRETVGSDNHHAKTQVASVDQSISVENKGFKLLAKMGWSEGQGLGKTGEGLKEPVPLVSNEGKAGLGAEVVSLPPTDGKTKRKQEIWKKTQLRYKTALVDNPLKSFSPDSEED